MIILKNPVSKRMDAERASEWYAREVHGCVLTRRAIKTKYNKVDFFGSDVVGKTIDGSHVYIQVTAGNDTQVTKRKRKLEKVPWHDTDTVELLQLVQTINPNHKARKFWWFRVSVYRNVMPGFNTREWARRDDDCLIPKLWFTAWKLEKEVNAKPKT